MKRLMKRWLHAACLLITAAALVACAAGPKLVAHAFTFDGWNDGWANSVDLLEFQYGDQYRMVQRKSKDDTGLGYRFGVNGDMPVGSFLQAKWRIKESGEILEDRVDLRDRLPADMRNHQVTFAIDGRQLYVYLITPEKVKNWTKRPTSRTWHSEFYISYEIYLHNELNVQIDIKGLIALRTTDPSNTPPRAASNNHFYLAAA
ncbi:MAG: hypothetical protein EKK53_21025 [Burkholderiales bacterium]|nr:MAG: hypothetical protein EKK53_21025 [Burkholderiales bacterium]